MRFAVVGDPVEHSQSPALHTAALSAVGLHGTYQAITTSPAEMPAIVERLHRGDLDGVNVTMPNKHVAAQIADHATSAVRRTGAANTLVRVGRRVIAHNTDIAGVRHAWATAHLPEGVPVLVLGAGGAAAAALLACEGSNLFVSARHPARAGDLIDRLGVVAQIVPWGEPVAGAVVVNSTPIGMRGEELPSDVVANASGFLDMTYGGGVTPALNAARTGGIPATDGVAMLIGQAMESFRLWTGRTPPIAAMESAVAGAGPSQSAP